MKTPRKLGPEILCREAYHRDFAAECELAREMLWGNGAVAIRMINSKDVQSHNNHNPWQGSYVVDTLTDLVEEAVYKEFEAISERGGVLGAMDTMYQRGKIQDESMYYEPKKHDGSLPLIGVNTFLPKDHAGEIATEIELIRWKKRGQKKGVRFIFPMFRVASVAGRAVGR